MFPSDIPGFPRHIPADIDQPPRGAVAHPPAKSRKLRRWHLLVLVCLAGAAIYHYRAALRPPEWWEQSWVNIAGETPSALLYRRDDAPAGELVLSKAGEEGKDGFVRSLAVVGGEWKGDLVLLVVEPEQRGRWPVYPQPAYQHYLLVRRAPGQEAELYRLNVAPERDTVVRLHRPEGPTGTYRVIYPSLTDLGKHTLMGRLTGGSKRER